MFERMPSRKVVSLQEGDVPLMKILDEGGLLSLSPSLSQAEEEEEGSEVMELLMGWRVKKLLGFLVIDEGIEMKSPRILRNRVACGVRGEKRLLGVEAEIEEEETIVIRDDDNRAISR